MLNRSGLMLDTWFKRGNGFEFRLRWSLECDGEWREFLLTWSSPFAISSFEKVYSRILEGIPWRSLSSRYPRMLARDPMTGSVAKATVSAFSSNGCIICRKRSNGDLNHLNCCSLFLEHRPHSLSSSACRNFRPIAYRRKIRRLPVRRSQAERRPFIIIHIQERRSNPRR